METLEIIKVDWIKLTHKLGKEFEKTHQSIR